MNAMLQVINQVFEIRQKAANAESGIYERNFSRLFSIFEEEGYIVQDPVNEPYHSSRTDCEASIIGEISSKMKIVKTLKPIIYKNSEGNVQLVQKAVVLAEKN